MSICLWVRHECKFQFDSHYLTIIFELFGRKIHPIVCNDAVRYPKMEYYLLDEIDRCRGI
jgi:hypothetical protein